MATRRTFLITLSSLTLLPALPINAGGHGRLGTFKGASNHVTTGRAEIAVEGGKTFVHLLSDFSFDGAPDPKIALGNNGYDASTILGKLQKNTGKQSYEVPSSIDTGRYNEVWIWCERFNVPLGVAKIN